MLFPEDALFGFVLADLAEQLSSQRIPEAIPLPCDRYVARSALQKAIRRGDVETAQRALSTMLLHDRYGIWRHLTVIALEDIGVANLDVLARIIAAKRDRSWRAHMGGDWPVLAELVRQMADSEHCQAACDLLLQVTISPAWERERTAAAAAAPSASSQVIRDLHQPLERRAIAVLAIGGGLTENQTYGDPDRVFCILGAAGYASHVVATCRAAWKIGRNPMAMLLPLLWQPWMDGEEHPVSDDLMPPTSLINGVPAYALDQFTRIGGNTARAYLAADEEMRRLLGAAQVPTGRRPRVVGDLLFLIEGSALARRPIWSAGERLRQPFRMLPAVPMLGEMLMAAIDILRSQGPLIDNLRQQNFLSAIQPNASGAA